MGKHIRGFICLVIIGILCLSGCDFLNRKPVDDDYFLTGKYDSWTETGAETNFEWLIKPSVPASNIIVADFSQVNTTKINRYFLNVAVIYSEGQYGFINYDGDMVVEPSFDHYYVCPCGEIVLYNANDDVVTEICTLDINGQPTFNANIHEDDSPSYYWDINTEKLFIKKKNEYFATPFNGDETIVAEQTNVTEIGYNTYSVPTNNSPVFAVFKDGERLTDFIYEDYYMPAHRSSNSTAIALKSNGKWGYINSNGKELIPFKFDDILSSYNGSYNGISDKSHPYLYSDGFVPVYDGSNFSYYDMDGKCVVPEGIFEQARPVINGKAWVKCDGKWGVIQLGEIREKFVTTTASTYATNNSWTTSSTSDTGTTTSVSQTTGGTTTNAQSTTSASQSEDTTTLPTETTPVVSSDVQTEPITDNTDFIE